MSDEHDPNIDAQKLIWRSQAGAVPGLLGGKSAWVPLVADLLEQINDGRAADLDTHVDLSFDLTQIEPRVGGAPPRTKSVTWRDYFGFLRAMGLASNSSGRLHLTDAGEGVRRIGARAGLGVVFADRIRLFAEALSVIADGPMTVDEVHESIQRRFGQLWRSNASTRSRMDWQEVLGLVESAGNRQWRITDDGRSLLTGRVLVTPAAVIGIDIEEVELIPATAGVRACLDELETSNRTHASRSTYNIWVPSPASSPNKVENLRTIVAATLNRIEREDLFSFICDRFQLKRSSVDSMLPFLRASGLLVEVSRGVFEATTVAREWLDSGDDLNFVRILHAHMRFVGEMIRSVESETTRSDMYAEAAEYGLNIDKCRWIAGFLLNTGLIEEPRYGSLRATPRGRALLAELPLAVAGHTDAVAPEEGPSAPLATSIPKAANFADMLVTLSKDPQANGMPAGRAFEAAVCAAFGAMGFGARVISGSGDTDVLVEWNDHDGGTRTAIVEAKARASGTVAHTDVSDVAIETHKGRHDASGVAVVGPGFSGQTIANMAAQKGWALIEADRLGQLADDVIAVGLRPVDVATLFATPNGITDVEDLIAARRRELAIVSFLVEKLSDEISDSGEPISARDISRDGRRTDLAPSVDEVVTAIETMSRLQIDSPRLVDAAADTRFATYVLGDSLSAVRQLRSIADAIERGSSK